MPFNAVFLPLLSTVYRTLQYCIDFICQRLLLSCLYFRPAFCLVFSLSITCVYNVSVYLITATDLFKNSSNIYPYNIKIFLLFVFIYTPGLLLGLQFKIMHCNDKRHFYTFLTVVTKAFANSLTLLLFPLPSLIFFVNNRLKFIVP